MNRRLCSVWDWREGLYRYYATPTLLDLGEEPRPTTPLPPMRLPLGDPPESLLRELPGGSLYVGKGARAQGEIVVESRVRP